MERAEEELVKSLEVQSKTATNWRGIRHGDAAILENTSLHFNSSTYLGRCSFV